MKLTPVISTLMVGLTLLPTPSRALTPRTVNALESVGRVTVAVLIGDSISHTHRKALFYGDHVRREAFEERLKLIAETTLGAAGIESGPEAEDYVHIGIWGHQDEQAIDGILAVHKIELTVVDHEYNPDDDCEEQRDLTTERGTMGVAELGELEKHLEAEVVRLIEETVPR